MNATDCLDAAALAAILENEAAEPVADHAEHLETCARCQQTLADLADASPCPDLARTLGRGSGSAANEPALERVMGRLKDRPPFPTETGEGIPDEDLSLAFLQPPNQPGVLGRFEVQEVIGRGGMGVVLRAIDPDLKRVVAIKVLLPHLASSAKARQRFKREAQAAAGWWTSGGEVGVWDLATHKPLQHFTEGRGVVSVAFSPNSKLLAFGSWTHHVRVLDWAAGKETADFTVQGLAHVAFSPDGSLLATASEGQTLQLWDLTKNELATDLEGDLLRFHRVIFTPDGKRLLAGGGDWQPGGINHLGAWDVASKKQIQKLAGHSNTVYCVACSPDGRTIATGSVDRTIRLWDAETSRLRRKPTEMEKDRRMRVPTCWSLRSRWYCTFGSRDIISGRVHLTGGKHARSTTNAAEPAPPS